MPQFPLLGTRASPQIPTTGTVVGYDPTTSGSPESNIQDELDRLEGLIAAGTGAFLLKYGGGVGNVNAHGILGATETIDLALGNWHWGTLDQNCTIGTTGWTAGKDCQIVLELIEDGTGGWTPTLSGVTWIGTAPTWDTTAATTTFVALFSRDGGSTIYGAVLGGGSGTSTTQRTFAFFGA